MNGLTLPYKLLLAVIGLFVYGIIFGIQGYTIGKGKIQKEFDAYKVEVKAESLKQKEKVDDIIAAQRKVQIGAADEYSKRITDIRQYYRMRQQSSSNSSNEVSSIPGTTGESKSTSPYDILAGQCAETTQQVISLQKTWEEQKKLYNEGMQ